MVLVASIALFSAAHCPCGALGSGVESRSPGNRPVYSQERLGVGAWDYQAATGFARLAVPVTACASGSIVGLP